MLQELSLAETTIPLESVCCAIPSLDYCFVYLSFISKCLEGYSYVVKHLKNCKGFFSLIN